MRDFAKATGRLAKTDALDAQVLVHFAEAVRPLVRQLRDDDAQELNAMTTRRNQAMTMLVAERNRLIRSIPSVRSSIRAHIAWLEQEFKDLGDGLRQTLRRSPVWREKDDLLGLIPGVGEQLSLSLLAYLPELGTLNRKQIAALVGVAPHQPGQRNHAGASRCLGRPSASARVLYMGALVASRRNPVICEFYQSASGGLAASKSKKVALTACMRKLLVILNDMIKSGEHRNPNSIVS